MSGNMRIAFCPTYLNKALIVHVREKSHKELTVHAICETAVTGDTLTKVFDFERSFDCAGKETSKRCNQRGKACHNDSVKLDRSNVHFGDLTAELRSW